VAALKGENELDVQIEYDRKSLKPGSADGQLKLAKELLEKGTPGSQDEAMTLLTEAARTSVEAKAELARCLLKGCPTPAPDPTEARQLLTDAALAGNPFALSTLAGSTDPNFFDLDPTLPAPERYAWSRFQARLNPEGCFGSSLYVAWAMAPTPPPNLLAMSPTDATAAEARAAQLLATQLSETRKLLRCD
jgi:TPR repeat protein